MYRGYVLGFCSSLLLGACGSSGSRSEKGDTEPVPTQETEESPSETLGPAENSAASILAFLQVGAWKNWTAESPIRPSLSAHGGKVQTFINQPLLDSLRARNHVHPVGSAAVKVLYADDGRTLKGYAFEQKTQEGDSGDAWAWYEGFAPNYTQPIFGQGLRSCTSCHGASGLDYVTVELAE